MVYDPKKHHRRSIRLRGYDYSQSGAYFVTIVAQNRARLFGNIQNGRMILNPAGEMVLKWWHELPKKFPSIETDAFIIMPDHSHGIIVANRQTGESAPTLGTVIQWFKTMTTNEYIRGVKNLGWKRFDKKLWQRNYYEHIIRSQKDWERIAHYIEANPANWDKDKTQPTP